MLSTNLGHKASNALIVRTLKLFGVTTMVAACVLYPLMIAIVALSAQGLICLLNAAAGFLARRPALLTATAVSAEFGPLVFSVHVPTHNEPPGVVIATLDSLRLQGDTLGCKVPAHEIIVIDNNTSDPALWQPVADWCAAHPRFHFLHRENVEGAKAGALNIALNESRPDATHIITVDADYQVISDFLSTAAEELTARHADFIQFPQAYHLAQSDARRPGGGIAVELADYFDRHASAANRADAMLLTGTLSVISKRALESVGGWSSRTSTEDAELGLRLAEAGYRGAYVHKSVGCGLLPLSLAALHHQRHRWASGNMRTLGLWISERWIHQGKPASGNLTRKILVAAQLTAWSNFALPAVLALTLGTLYSALWSMGAADMIAQAGLLTLCLVFLSAVIPLCMAKQRGRSDLLVAICSRISLLPTAATATMAGLMPLRQGFKVTPKSMAEGSPATDDGLFGARLTAIWGCGLGGTGLVLGSFPTLASGALLTLPLLASGCATRALDSYSSFVSSIQRQGA